jgi:uncharacterized membrane protein HdeD (DUF308 family)
LHDTVAAGFSWPVNVRLKADATANKYGGVDMKPVSMVGVLLVVLGILALIYQGITYTKRETVLDIGPVHATADREKTVPLPPVVGALALVGGVVLLVTGARKTS